MAPLTDTMAPITDISQLDLSQTYSYADYLSWKFSEYVELIRGRVLRKMSAPTTFHQIVSSNFNGIIWNYLKGKPCRVFPAPFDVRLLRSTGNGDTQVQTVVQPDLCVICDLSKVDKRGCLGAPDWIIEIVSPSTATHDTKTKFDLYAENGVGEYWIVYPGEQAISVFVLEGDEYQPKGDYYEPGLVPSHTLPELQLQWADVFEGLS
ncbi:Uma2 family endonuclease [Hymenobacter baengnokdamensis]|uniref:Uma2 family endonuclease n=1 Tax=Hymenobacter baengnokdamensis TaxID=2615203 RepID=UPI001E482E3A|nr:Uma2 family endonuclease [Hymenobacter baengnokdamensis]